jgi:hypothetical protein
MRLPDAYSVLMPFQKNADKRLKLKFQNINVLDTKAKFDGNNSHFLYFLDKSN